ncbi:MAG: HD domain-containing protein [Clostridiales bacterium]|nr:HD domain-containing protein [Clostridiales bacterium]
MEDFMYGLGGSYIVNHGRRTLHIAKLIAVKEKLEYDEDILIFAAYFHDISAFAPYRPEGVFDHALESSKVVPQIAEAFGFSDDEIETIIEAVKYHDKANLVESNEALLIRNADGVDYLGFMTIARDFSKSPKDMKKAIAMMKKHRENFSSIIELDIAKEMMKTRLKDLDYFLKTFEKDSFGLY